MRYTALPIAVCEQNDFSTTPLHNHDEYEILSILDGSCSVNIGSYQHQANKGDIIFVNPMEIHEVLVDTSHPYRHRCICFDASLIINPVIKYPLAVHHINDRVHSAYITELFDKIYSSYEKSDSTAPMDIPAYFTLIFSYLVKNTLMLQNITTSEDAQFSQDIISYIRKHYGENITSRQYAGDAFINHSYFCRKFKKNFGKSFSEYLKIYRLSVARRMLEDTGADIGAVALSCGFDSSAYFSKCFKDYVGISPAQYKRGQRNI